MKTDFKKFLPYLPLLILFLALVVGGIFYVFKPYTITVDLGDGSTPVTRSYSVASGSIPLGTPKREGYSFLGWTGANGKTAQYNVVVWGGSIGDRYYVAKWSKKLTVTCEDWIIDADGNLVANITNEVDSYLKAGNKKVKSRFKKRTKKVKSGDVVDPAEWGEVEEKNYYSDRYVYVGNSGEKEITEDGTVVYRYFYPYFAVNFLVDNITIKSYGVKSVDLARFNLYINGEQVASNVNTFSKAVPVGTWYNLEVVWTNPKFKYQMSGSEFGKVGNDKHIAYVRFATREGDYTATCRDYITDANGKRIKDITNDVDVYLRHGKSEMKYPVITRTVEVSDDDRISGADWGHDESPKAYHSDYCYAGSSKEVKVDGNSVGVYRCFYPLLDIRIKLDGMVQMNDSVEEDEDTAAAARFDLYVDGEPVARDITEFKGGVPYGSTYEIRNAVSDQGYTYVPGEKDSGIMGIDNKTIKLDFVSEPVEVEETGEEEVVGEENGEE